jgi:hypothetical protein
MRRRPNPDPTMLRNAKELLNHSLRAEDGLIGTVRDFYFDDVHWTVRYLVVGTGGWLNRQMVLISPEALKVPDWDDQAIPVRLTRAQVKASPDIDMAKPVSRQHEAELRAHYGWPPYWGSMYVQPPAKTTGAAGGDPHLRSTSEVIGDRLDSPEGEIGHVDDVLIDDVTWILRYLVIDTRSWWPGRKVVISPLWVTGIDWARSKITSQISQALIKDSPTYDPQHPLDASYADRLHDHYGRARHGAPGAPP